MVRNLIAELRDRRIEKRTRAERASLVRNARTSICIAAEQNDIGELRAPQPALVAAHIAPFQATSKSAIQERCEGIPQKSVEFDKVKKASQIRHDYEARIGPRFFQRTDWSMFTRAVSKRALVNRHTRYLRYAVGLLVQNDV